MGIRRDRFLFGAFAIPHDEQRYETCGDWKIADSGFISITVSAMPDTRSEFAVAIHELIESYLCKLREIPEEKVTEFDIAYEASRKPEDATSEPGDSVDAPYWAEHQFATRIERLVCEEMGLDWNEHEANVNAL